MGMKKTTSLKASFWKFLCMLLIGLIGAVAIPFSLILAGTSTGLITYADYSERCTKDLAPVIAATPDLADVQLPMGCKYLVLDKNYQVTETTLEGDDLDRAMEYAISGKINSNLNKQYLFVTRKNEYVVLQYYIGSQFTNEWLYEHLPSPEILLYIFIAINCIAVCVILTAKFAKNMRTQLSPLFEATRQVAEQNLDFEVEHSKIKEFEDVLCSFANMKDNLKISLSITDEGGGFTPEALHHAQEQFFMGDKSRTSNMHFGMGLYITSSIIKQHGGQLVLSNSKKTGGAQAIIKIPY